MFISGNRPVGRKSIVPSSVTDFFKPPEEDEEIRRRGRGLSVDWSQIVTRTTQDATAKKDDFFIPEVINVENDIQFCTGSSYAGGWHSLGMNGDGTYTYPQGSSYEGEFEDGRFHGQGILIFPMGQKLKCVWDRGKLISYTYLSVDGLGELCKGEYCLFPDRRYVYELKEGLQPASREILTNQQPTRPLPDGMCDTGDGYFNPDTRAIMAARDPALYKDIDDAKMLEKKAQKTKPVKEKAVVKKDEGEEEGEEGVEEEEEEKEEDQVEEKLWLSNVTIVSEEKAKFIIEKYRKGWDESAGCRPEYYEAWITGREPELRAIDVLYGSYIQKKSDDLLDMDSLSDA